MTTFFIIVIIVILLMIIAKTTGTTTETPIQAPEKTTYFRKEMVVEIPQKHFFEKKEVKFFKYLVVDVETTGFPPSSHTIFEQIYMWPYILQISWVTMDSYFTVTKSRSYYTNYGGSIPDRISSITGITERTILEEGRDISDIMIEFVKDCYLAESIVAHNADFDLRIIGAELYRNGFGKPLEHIKPICTMKGSKKYVEARNVNGHLKNPNLAELHNKCFGYYPNDDDLHNSEYDVAITAKCLAELIKNDIIKN